MPLLPGRRARLLAATKESAAALMEDLEYVRGVVGKKDLTSGEIRRLSGVLRRIIVEDDLSKVAGPRLGKVTLIGPDNEAAYKADQVVPFMIFVSGRAKVLGGWSGVLSMREGEPDSQPETNVDGRVNLTLDSFRAQKVICYRGKWLKRVEIIKYVANVASGVHSSVEKSEDEKLISAIRNNVRLSRKENTIHLDFFQTGIDNDEPTFRYEPDGIDAVLIEILAAGTFLINSPFIHELENFIRAELRGPVPTPSLEA